MIVKISEHFINGHLNSEYFKDIPHLTRDEKVILRNFVFDVTNDRALLGKNKTSWQNNQGKTIPNTLQYQQGNCWHHHCGPYHQTAAKVYTVHLAWNIYGLTSSAVLHYQKITETEIFVLAYSLKHLPFPNENLSGNPLIGRLQ